MSTQEPATFPYSNNPTIPRTDGIVSDSSLSPGTMYIPGPSDIAPSETPPSKRGFVSDDAYVGDTRCVDTSTTGHKIFTGSF